MKREMETRIFGKTGCPVSVIGDITEEKLATRVTVVDSKGNITPYKKGGWEHFKNGVPKVKLA